MSRAKNWLFTLFLDPGEDGLYAVPGWPFNGLRYGVYQLERCPTTGRIHAQGYCQFERQRRLSQLKRLSQSAHWTCARGTPGQNRAYCTKEDTRVADSAPVEYGVIDGATSQGKAQSVAEAVSAIRASADYQEAALLEEYPAVWARYPDLIGRVRLVGRGSELRGITTILILGEPGVGKSSLVYERYPGAYWKPPGKWWNGYTGQSTIVFDDFDGSWFTCTELLRILNPFPTAVEGKGSVYNLCSTNFVFTSNHCPAEWYAKHIVAFPAHKRALERRFDFVIHKVGDDWWETPGADYFAPPPPTLFTGYNAEAFSPVHAPVE